VKRKNLYEAVSGGRTNIASTPRSFTSPIPRPQKTDNNPLSTRTISVERE
jgi:hypothetical protein